MTSFEGAIEALHAHLGSFAGLAAGELGSLRRNLDQKPLAGATTYKHTLSSLSSELDESTALLNNLMEQSHLTSFQVSSVGTVICPLHCEMTEVCVSFVIMFIRKLWRVALSIMPGLVLRFRNWSRASHSMGTQSNTSLSPLGTLWI